LSDKQRFQEILTEIRHDLQYLTFDLFFTLIKKIKAKNYQSDSETKDWIFDTFLDKWYEVDTKINMILRDFKMKADVPLIPIKHYSEQVAYEQNRFPPNIEGILEKLYDAGKNYEKEVESVMSSIRKTMYQTEWDQMKNIKSEKYIAPMVRKRYIEARDELEKAKQSVKDKKWDEVLNHLRPAIDLAIKEKFGFKKIQPMKQFIQDAEKYDLPLPSYAMLYDYFDEGSQRIHEGKLHTPWECEKALNFVAEFIDRLDLIDMSAEDIEEFKRKSKAAD